ncbi:T-kininogen 1-like [Pelobates fuscus]|uniref:T-kininogen 1-like n=1 Tax=Pelobates fuscus TaxID=191477 RepID=UPI002FE4E970
MMALGTFLLFAPLLIVSANQALIYDADCNDANIFKAVDVALKSYNAGKVFGNLFTLHRITTAGIRPESTGFVHNFVDYEIRESVCKTHSGIDWKNCDFLTPTLAVGKCSAHVVLNQVLNSSDVLSQNCIPPEDTPELLGEMRPIDPNREDVLILAQLSIERMNNLGRHPFYFALEKIETANRQLVSGWNYLINYTVRQTNCSKSEIKNVSSEECSFDINGQSGKCATTVHRNLQQTNEITYLHCTSDSGFCLECANEVEPNNPELLNLLKQFVDEHNANSRSHALYKLSEVVRATKEGSDLEIYEVELKISETNCSRTEHAILGEECDILINGDTIYCEIQINSTGSVIQPCVERKIMVCRFQGFSPLRSARHRREFDHNSKEHRKEKHESSEESNEVSTPGVTATTMPLGCPGKEWQPYNLPEDPGVQTLAHLSGFTPLRSVPKQDGV